jgi:hypothetical protein
MATEYIKWSPKNQKFPFKGFPKFAEIGGLVLKIYHLATLTILYVCIGRKNGIHSKVCSVHTRLSIKLSIEPKTKVSTFTQAGSLNIRQSLNKTMP